MRLMPPFEPASVGSPRDGMEKFMHTATNQKTTPLPRKPNRVTVTGGAYGWAGSSTKSERKPPYTAHASLKRDPVPRVRKKKATRHETERLSQGLPDRGRFVLCFYLCACLKVCVQWK